ncbi:hypothetical protein CR513_35507, partial [Mucuna pruriens]
MQDSTEDLSRISTRLPCHCPNSYKRMWTLNLTIPTLKFSRTPNWELPFELMCDASNSALGAVLGQKAGVGKPVHVIAYASRTMDSA